MANMNSKITKSNLRHLCLMKHFEENNLDIHNADLRRAYKAGFSTGWKQSKKFMQKKREGGFEFHFCSTCNSREYHARVSKEGNEYLVCDFCSKITEILDSESTKPIKDTKL